MKKVCLFPRPHYFAENSFIRVIWSDGKSEAKTNAANSVLLWVEPCLGEAL